MKTVHEVSRITGVSVRTLHHYDAIGLLRPTKLTEAGYRLYDDAALARLQSILLFRELQFPLREIGAILDTPGFDPRKALADQIALLEMQRRRLDGILALARQLQQTGEGSMDFKAFDKNDIERYAAEAKEKWGGSKAYAAYEQKAENRSAQEEKDMGNALMALFADLGALRGQDPRSAAVQEKIGAIRAFISANYYECSKEILAGLGEMYVADERMRHNIDASGGEGTAQLAAEAIKVYCR